MRVNYLLIMDWLAVYEGGFVDHPRDPGGATMRGVTQRVYDAFRRRQGMEPRFVMWLTDAEHEAIYRRQYWMPIKGDELPSGLDATVFDFAVNSGVSRSAKTLQRALRALGYRIAVDGQIGEMTLDAIEAAVRADKLFDLIIRINTRRMSFLRGLSTFSTFGRGWTRRVMGEQDGAQVDDIGVVDRSIMLARGDAGSAIPMPRRHSGKVPQGEGKGEARDRSWIAVAIRALIDLIDVLFRKDQRGVA